MSKYTVQETIDNTTFGGSIKRFDSFKDALAFTLSKSPPTAGANGWAIFHEDRARMRQVDAHAGVSSEQLRKALGRFPVEVIDDTIWVGAPASVIRETVEQIKAGPPAKTKIKPPQIKVTKIGVAKVYGQVPEDRMVEIKDQTRSLRLPYMTESDAKYLIADLKRGWPFVLGQPTTKEMIDLVGIASSRENSIVDLQIGESRNDVVTIGSYKSRPLAEQARHQLQQILLSARTGNAYALAPLD